MQFAKPSTHINLKLYFAAMHAGLKVDISIEWQSPIQLTKSKQLIFDGKSIPDEITNDPGVYYFSRRHGPVFTPFYIGETLTLRNRLKNHLNSVAIVDVLRGMPTEDDLIRQGSRYFHYGFFIGKSKQDAKSCLEIVQRVMIRQAVEEGIPILNKSLTKIKTHTINFDGSVDGRGWFDHGYSAEA